MTGGAMRALPPLTKRQMARLVEIAQTVRYAWADEKPATTAHLEGVGLLSSYVLRAGPNTTRKVVFPSPLGLGILAGLPGEEFDRFRAALAAPEPPHV